MTSLLYISAHPMDEAASNSVAVGRAFLSAYRDAHPQDSIKELDLYKISVPHLDRDVFNAWNKLRNGVPFTELLTEEQYKASLLESLVEEFIAADKYVFVTPMWNFSYPPVVKAYLDALAIPGKTFKYTDQGSVGLLKDKKALHIQSRGGIYSSGPAAGLEAGHFHLRVMMQFFGIPSLEALFIEGHNVFLHKAALIKQEALERAQSLALTF